MVQRLPPGLMVVGRETIEQAAGTIAVQQSSVAIATQHARHSQDQCRQLTDALHTSQNELRKQQGGAAKMEAEAREEVETMKRLSHKYVSEATEINKGLKAQSDSFQSEAEQRSQEIIDVEVIANREFDTLQARASEHHEASMSEVKQALQMADRANHTKQQTEELVRTAQDALVRQSQEAQIAIQQQQKAQNDSGNAGRGSA